VPSLRERGEEAAREDLARELTHRVRGEAIVHRATQAVASARAAGLPVVIDEEFGLRITGVVAPARGADAPAE
jgi:hypothetical protein